MENLKFNAEFDGNEDGRKDFSRAHLEYNTLE